MRCGHDHEVELSKIGFGKQHRRHPGPVIGGEEGSGVDSVILQIWLLAFLGMTILMIGQAMVSWEVQKCERRLAELQQRMD